VYLVLDMQNNELTVVWDPSANGYRSRSTKVFGEPLHVPAPFGFDLDTTGFAPPAEAGQDEV
jgi:hypothetical protein